MQPNKFFNDSTSTASGKPKFLPPQKRVQQDEPYVESTQPVQKTMTTESKPFSRTDFYKEDRSYNQPSQTSNYSYNSNTGYKNAPYKNFGQKQDYGHHGFQNRNQHSHHQSHSADPTQHHFNDQREDNYESKRFPTSTFERNRPKIQSTWGYRHLRSGRMDPEVLEEERALFETPNSANPLLVDNAKSYDHLKVEIINKFNLPMPETISEFKDLNLAQGLNDNIERCGYTKLTIIQKNAIPIMNMRNNIMASSQTGSGKTASFLLPIIQNLLQSGPPKNDVSKEEFKKTRKCFPLAIVMAPTRELAIQIHEEARKFCHLTGVLPKVIYGGKEAYNQQRYLSWDGCDILIATPGRLIDFMGRIVDLSFVRFIVLDEADRMLDMGFEPQIRNIMDECFAQTQGEHVQVAMFSATFPKEVKGLAEKYLQKYVYVGIGSEGKTGSVSKTIKQVLVDARHSSKNQLLFDQIKSLDGKILVFCAKKDTVASVYVYLSGKNLFVSNIHGGLAQKEREAELSLFKNKCSILVATDVASRGLDIPNVAYVINYDLPTNIESYIHRIGRTGRIGKEGTAISFLTDLDEPMFYKLYNVLKESNQELPTWFSDQIRIKNDREERYNPYSRPKPSHHKWRGGGRGGSRGGGGYRGAGNFVEEDIGFDSDYGRPNTRSYRGGGHSRFNDRNDRNFGYE